MLLGFGAPAGGLLLRLARGVPSLAEEWNARTRSSTCTSSGTCLIFGTAGVFVGLRADRLRRGRDRYRELSEQDSLTGLVNARAFFVRYRRALDHARRFREPLSLLIVDVDRLKSLNDRFGHAFGSAALRHVAKVLSGVKREDDMAARWGGDEFALLMPGADETAARRQAQAILEGLRDASSGNELMEVSVTIGVATATERRPMDDLFERADRALFEGKRSGRSQVRQSP